MCFCHDKVKVEVEDVVVIRSKLLCYVVNMTQQRDRKSVV